MAASNPPYAAARYPPLAPSQPRDAAAAAVTDDGPRPLKRVRLACQQCRQSKLRCESAGVDTPCDRCGRMGIDCIYDNGYRRENKRAKIEELVDEVQQLRSVVQRTASSPDQAGAAAAADYRPASAASPEKLPSASRAGPAGGAGFSAPLASPSAYAGAPSLTESSSRPAQASRDSAPAARHARSLQETVLEPAQIDRLFDTYFACYHAYFPIVDPAASADQYFAWSPALFWAIVCIAARRDDEDTTLMGVLGPNLRDLVFSSIGRPPHSKHTIQAWVLLCLWSLPTQSMTTDPTYMLASAAKSSAMHVGLHRPEIVQDFSRIKLRFGLEELQDAVRTWVGCFIAAESVTSYVGQASLHGPDHTLEFLAANPNSELLPEELMEMMQAYRFLNRATRVLNGHEMHNRKLFTNESRLLLRMLEQDFSDLCDSIPTRSVASEILLLYVSLHLRCYYFLEQPGANKKEGLLKGYAAALELASKGREAQVERRFFAHAPNVFQQGVIVAALFITKIARSSYRHAVDAAEAKRSFSVCHTLIRQMSVEDNDLRGRTAKILEQLWNSADRDQLAREPALRITSRLGANLLHDMIWTWRERFGAPPRGGATDPRTPLAASTPATLEEAAAMAARSSAAARARRESAATSPSSTDPARGPALYGADAAPAPDPDAATSSTMSPFDPNAKSPALLLGLSTPQLNMLPPPTDVPSGLDANYDIALLPDDFLDSYWESQLDGLFPLNFSY